MSTHLARSVIVWLISNMVFLNIAFTDTCTTEKQSLTIFFINGVLNKTDRDIRFVRNALKSILTRSPTNLGDTWKNLRFNYIWQTTVVHWWKIHKIFVDFAPWDTQGRVYQVASDNYFNPDQTLAELRRLGLHPSQRPGLYDIPPGTTLTDEVIKQALEDTLDKSYREVFSDTDIVQIDKAVTTVMAEIGDERSVVLVAHSQGSYFANIVIREIHRRAPQYAGRVGSVFRGPVATYQAGYYPGFREQYITWNEDWVVRRAKSVLSNILPDTIPFSQSGIPDNRGYRGLSYHKMLGAYLGLKEIEINNPPLRNAHFLLYNQIKTVAEKLDYVCGGYTNKCNQYFSSAIGGNNLDVEIDMGPPELNNCGRFDEDDKLKGIISDGSGDPTRRLMVRQRGKILFNSTEKPEESIEYSNRDGNLLRFTITGAQNHWELYVGCRSDHYKKPPISDGWRFFGGISVCIRVISVGPNSPRRDNTATADTPLSVAGTRLIHVSFDGNQLTIGRPVEWIDGSTLEIGNLTLIEGTHYIQVVDTKNEPVKFIPLAIEAQDRDGNTEVLYEETDQYGGVRLLVE